MKPDPLLKLFNEPWIVPVVTILLLIWFYG
jgi:hypothetical protein